MCAAAFGFKQSVGDDNRSKHQIVLAELVGSKAEIVEEELGDLCEGFVRTGRVPISTPDCGLSDT